MNYKCIIGIVFVIMNAIMYCLHYSENAGIIIRYLSTWSNVVIAGNICAILITTAIIMIKKNINRTISYMNVFSFIMMLFIGISIGAGVLTNGEVIRAYLFYDKTDMFMDFFNSIQYGFEPYGNKVIYPPLINIFYAFCGSMIPLSNEINSHAIYIRELQMAWIVLYGVMVLSMLGISLLIWQFLNDEKIEARITFLISIFFSLPFVFLVERGNSLLQTLMFLLLFLFWYKSESRVRKYLAYVSLGIATGIKIVPVIFGLLIIRRKVWKEVGISAIIVGFVFFIPFFFLDGSFSTLIANIQHTTTLMTGSRFNSLGSVQMIGNGVFVNLWNTLDTLGRIFNINLWNISKIMSILILSLSVGCICFVRDLEEWKVVALLSLIIILIPGFSGVYCLCYMILPLVMFIRDEGEKRKRINDVYIFLFLCMFIPIINFRLAIFKPFVEDAYLMRLSTIVESCALLVMLVMVLGFSIKQINIIWKKRIISCSVFITMVFSLIVVIPYKPALSFIPGDMSIVNASEGMVLENGRYCGIMPDGKLILQAEKIKKYGLIVAAEKGHVGEYVNLYLDGNKVANKLLDDGSWYIYITAEQISKLNISDTVDISLSYEGNNAPVYLSYVGMPRLPNLVNQHSYMDDISEGFWRKKDEAILRMKNTAHVLLAGDVAKNGLLVRYRVPDNLLVSNPSKDIELDFYIDGRRVKSVLVANAGEQVLSIQKSDLISGEVPYALDLTIKCNAIYRESDDGESLNSREQSIELISIGNVDSENDIISHPFKGYEKYFLSADELKEKGFCLTYYISPSKLQNLSNSDLQMDVIIDGEVVVQKKLINGNSLDGIYLPKEIFSNSESVVCAEIRLASSGSVPWKILFDDPELVNVLYIGTNKIDYDYELSGNRGVYNTYMLMEGVRQDPKDKKMYLGQKGTILFLKKDMIGHDFVIDYDVPRFLINDSNPKLTVKIDGEIIKKDILDKAGHAVLRIPSEQLQMVLADDQREVVPVHLVVNKVFDPNVLHIFGIGGGEKSIILNRVYLD